MAIKETTKMQLLTKLWSDQKYSQVELKEKPGPWLGSSYL